MDAAYQSSPDSSVLLVVVDVGVEHRLRTEDFELLV